MTEFLVNKFIKDSANIESTEVRTRYGMLASVVGIFCNVLLFSVKLAIGDRKSTRLNSSHVR